MTNYSQKEKEKEGDWESLGEYLKGKEGISIRQVEEEKYRRWLQEQSKIYDDNKGLRERKCVGLTMNRDESKRDDIQHRKQQAFSQILKEENETEHKTIDEQTTSENPMETNGREKMMSKKKNKKVPSHDANFAGELALIKDQDQCLQSLPPRCGATIKVHLSESSRLPARESRKGEEEEWRKRVDEGKKKVAQINADEKENEKTQDLDYFHKKGVNFIQCEDYRSAENILLEGLKFYPKNINLLSNVSLVYLVLEDWNNLNKYSTQAIHLLTPEVPENIGQKGKLYCRRANCYIQTDQLHKALDDLNEAVRLLPQDKRVRKDRDSLKEFISEQHDM